ncbi:MAG: class I SAM-dependent methyltransferase [Hyphomicrobiaceae bacterium]|nr:class I SAM-dependent methyltransferase [Hyphomicrobiaceae bacterium]
MTFLGKIALACAVAALPLSTAQSQDAPRAADYAPVSGQEGKDVVWVPTAQALVDRMLTMAKITPDDFVVDLGSGDGRTVITAAKRGVRAHGIEYNPELVALSERNAKEAGVDKLATFERADIFQSDFSKATVVTLFLLPALNVKLRPTLLGMKPGTRVVSNSFDMGDWEPDGRIEAGGSNCTSYCRAMMWVIPAKVGGAWRLGDGALQLTQTYQMLGGTLTRGRKVFPISSARMAGTSITFTAGGKRYDGRVDHGTMTGHTEGGGAWTATRVGH